jgi:hypothetical protein
MEELGFCTMCHQEIPLAESTTIRERDGFGRMFIIGADRRAHSLVFGKAAQNFEARLENSEVEAQQEVPDTGQAQARYQRILARQASAKANEPESPDEIRRRWKTEVEKEAA